MKTAHFVYVHDSACPFVRLLQPARFCAPAFERVGWRLTVAPGVPADPDVILFHGLPVSVDVVLEIAQARQRGAKFVWSLDDDFPTIPDWNPAQLSDRGRALFQLVKGMADFVLCSTPALAATFPEFGDRVDWAPNLLDLTQFPVPPHEGKVGPYSFAAELPVRVVWVGGHTHQGDINLLERPVDQLLRRFGPDKVQVVFAGMMPPGDLLRNHLHRGVLHHPPVPFPLYRATINTIRPHVWLAPLADVPFNLSKSNIRLLEGWALTAAPVATPVGEYACVRAGTDGRFADSAEAWLSALTRLVTDHEHRITLGVEGRRRVVEEYNWARPSCRRRWVEVLAKIFGVDPPPDEG